MDQTPYLEVPGGGVVGLALAPSWLLREPQSCVVVLEKKRELAARASNRNSGVLHAGFYYAPDSIRARLTRDGNRQLRAFCAERGSRVREAGKAVASMAVSQLATLVKFATRGRTNGAFIEMRGAASLRAIEKVARTVTRALGSPTTVAADPAQGVHALANDLRGRVGRIEIRPRAHFGGPGRVTSSTAGCISGGHVIGAAGPNPDTVTHGFGQRADFRMRPMHGLSRFSIWNPGRLKRHICPVAAPPSPFVGVHLPVTVDGTMKDGPMAIPARWREACGGLSKFSPEQLDLIARLYPRFLTSSHHDVPALIRSELPKYWRRHLGKQVVTLALTASPADFRTQRPVGVWAQLLHVPSSRLEMDLVMQSGERSTCFLNVVSPAPTRALAVGEHVTAEILGGHSE